MVLVYGVDRMGVMETPLLLCVGLLVASCWAKSPFASPFAHPAAAPGFTTPSNPPPHTTKHTQTPTTSTVSTVSVRTTDKVKDRTTTKTAHSANSDESKAEKEEELIRDTLNELLSIGGSPSKTSNNSHVSIHANNSKGVQQTSSNVQYNVKGNAHNDGQHSSKKSRKGDTPESQHSSLKTDFEDLANDTKHADSKEDDGGEGDGDEESVLEIERTANKTLAELVKDAVAIARETDNVTNSDDSSPHPQSGKNALATDTQQQQWGKQTASPVSSSNSQWKRTDTTQGGKSVAGKSTMKPSAKSTNSNVNKTVTSSKNTMTSLSVISTTKRPEDSKSTNLNGHSSHPVNSSTYIQKFFSRSGPISFSAHPPPVRAQAYSDHGGGEGGKEEKKAEQAGDQNAPADATEGHMSSYVHGKLYNSYNDLLDKLPPAPPLPLPHPGPRPRKEVRGPSLLSFCRSGCLSVCLTCING
jgi:hypothetical protein